MISFNTYQKVLECLIPEYTFEPFNALYFRTEGVVNKKQNQELYQNDRWSPLLELLEQLQQTLYQTPTPNLKGEIKKNNYSRPST